jgi:hypothetical protein
VLSRDCDGCSQYKACSIRYRNVVKGEKVYCADGTVHLVNENTAAQSSDLYEQYYEMFQ